MLFFLATLLAMQIQGGLIPFGQPFQPAGTVAGQLLRTDGAPAANVRVIALDADDSRDEKSLTGVALTDSEGRYRIDSLVPGRYLISAGALATLTYYPGVTVRKLATAVTVSSGTTTGIDFRLMPVLPSTVSGRIISEDGQSLSGKVWLIGGEFVPSAFPFAEPNLARASVSAVDIPPRFAEIRNGSFEFLQTTPGNYHLIMSGMERPLVLPGGTNSSIAVEGRDVTGLEIRILSPVYVVQSIRTEDGSPVPQLDLIVTSLQFRAITNRKGLPSLAGALYEGDYNISVANLPSSYFVKSMTSDGVDLSREPLRVRPGPRAMEFSIVLGKTR
jgi:hypothetical protein